MDIPDWQVDKRDLWRYLLVVGIILGAGTMLAANTFQSNEAVNISNGVTVSPPQSDFAVTVKGDTELALSDAFPADETVELRMSEGNITLAAASGTDATVYPSNITGTWTNVSSITAGGTWIEIYPDDKQRVDVRGDLNKIGIRDVTLDDGTTDFYVDGTDGGTASVRFYTLPADTEIRAIDPTSQELLDVATTDGSGQATFDIPLSSHTVELQTTDDTVAPDQTNVSPQGPQSTAPDEISVDVSDGDFPYDEVQVTITLDGTQLKQVNITNAQTVTAQIPQSGKTGGDHDYTIALVDSYGNSNTESYTYAIPDTLYVRNATNHSELVPANGEITFFGADAVYTRTTSDGTLNMTGLPVNQEFLVRVEPTSNDYTTRVYYFKSIFQQQNVYLLNATAYPTIESRFVLNDPTGEFGSESVLYIQRPIVINGTNTWQTIYADEFGVEGVTVVLEQNERYRIKISNDQTSQVIGPYRADVGETVEVVPGSPSVTLPEFEDGWAANATIVDGSLQWRYSDPSGETDRLDVIIYEKNNKSNVLFEDEYFDIGNVSGAPPLTENQTEITWVVEFQIDREGESFTHKEVVGAPGEEAPQLGGNWQWIAGVVLLFLLAAAFSQLNAAVGAVVVSLFGGLLWYIGLLDGATSGAAVVVALFLSVVNHIRTSGGP